jgi:hypothetical protein
VLPGAAVLAQPWLSADHGEATGVRLGGGPSINSPCSLRHGPRRRRRSTDRFSEHTDEHDRYGVQAPHNQATYRFGLYASSTAVSPPDVGSPPSPRVECHDHIWDPRVIDTLMAARYHRCTRLGHE